MCRVFCKGTQKAAPNYSTVVLGVSFQLELSSMKKDNSDSDREIDLAIEQTEKEWAYTAQRFFERVTPLWFNWLGWVFATGGVAYLAQKTSSVYLVAIEKISYTLLMFYFMYFFISIRIEPYHSWVFKIKSKPKMLLAMLPALILGLALALGSQILITGVIEQIKVANAN
jgi:hypothetical protein